MTTSWKGKRRSRHSLYSYIPKLTISRQMGFKINQLDIELYTDLKNPDLEETIEAVLLKHGIFYGKSETWIESEKLYEVLYETEV